MTICSGRGSPPAWAEADRLSALRGTGILDTASETAFDDIAGVAARACQAPIAVVNFIDEGRQWFKSAVGLEVCETPLDVSICVHAILQPGLFVVPDTTKDPRFARNPLVTGEPHLRFYAGALLETNDGLPLGTLCVLDYKPRPAGLTPDQAETLLALARTVMTLLSSRQTNDALRESRRELATLTDTLPQIVWSTGPDGRDNYNNQRWYEFTGVEPGSPCREQWAHFIHPADKDRATVLWEHSLRTGEPYECEYRLRHHSGEYRWILSRGVPVHDEDGAIRRWYGTNTDIHRGKLAEEALARSEKRYRALIEASATIEWATTADGAMTRGSGWGELSGQLPEHSVGDGWLKAVHPLDRERLREAWKQVVASESPGTAEFRIRRSDGSYRWVVARGVPLKDDKDSVQEWVGTTTDIHDYKLAEGALRESEERLRLALETTGTGIWDADLVTGHRQWTSEAREIVGLSADAPISRNSFLDRIHPEDRARMEGTFFVDGPAERLSYTDTCRILRADNGDERWVTVSGLTVLDGSGRPVRKIGTIRDVTAHKRAEDALRSSEERLRLALQVGRMVAWEQDLATGYVIRSRNAVDLLGIGSGPLAEFLERVHPEDRARRNAFIGEIDRKGSDTMEFRFLLPDGRTMWLASRGEKAGPGRLVGVSFDITDRKSAEDEVWRVANHDALTGLPNRALFQKQLERALAASRRTASKVSLLLIDLDHFKDINDSLGHDAGDALLKETAERLLEAVRGCDMVARFGGDEFAVIVAEPPDPEHVAGLAERLVRELARPFAYGGRTFATRTSIGFATVPDDAADPMNLLKNADIALYRAKAQGRNQAVAFSPDMRTAIERRVSLGVDIRAAIAAGQVVPFYQPKVCLTTGRTIGLEALVRWRHPTEGVLTPISFADAFDDTELATAIGGQVMAQVASDIRRWLDSGLNPGRVAINLSSAEFNQPGLCDRALGILEQQRVSTQYLEVEVTETVLLGQRAEEVATSLRRFHERGVQIALDDFGTGYASLTHLKQFPVDHVKIDRSFIRDLEQDEDDKAIVSAVISLGRSLGLQVTAEGVETHGQVQILRKLGCHNAQGYVYARPMDARQVPRLLSSNNRSDVA